MIVKNMRIRKIFWFSLIALCYYLAAGTELFAHATLLSSQPEAGANYDLRNDDLPEIRLRFDEAVGAGSSFLIFDEAFKPLDLVVSIDLDNPTDLVAPPPVFDQAGLYTLQWIVISQDGHPIEGAYSFTIETGEDEMELVALAEEVNRINPPNWVGVLMVLLAIVVPFAVYFSLNNNKR